MGLCYFFVNITWEAAVFNARETFFFFAEVLPSTSDLRLHVNHTWIGVDGRKILESVGHLLG